MGKLKRLFWESAVDGLGLPKAERRGGHFDAYVPDRLAGRDFALSGEVATRVTDATLAIQQLDMRAAALTNTEALARLLLRAESVASSRIEGLEVSPQRLLRADIARREGLPTRNDATATEVLANIDAMSYAIGEATGAVTVARILEVHRRLLAPTPRAHFAGVLRTEQNWIGGNSYNPIGADYVPPPPEAVSELLEDLATFCSGDGLPAVAQAAIAHAQFETIHPFADGNGRTGRALISMVMRRRGLAQRATPPVSLVLATYSKDYIRTMSDTRAIGPPSAPAASAAMNRWIAFFADATTRAVADAETFERRVGELQANWRARLPNLRADAAALRLIDQLPATPIITVRGAAEIIGRTFAPTNAAIEQLVAKGILMPATGGRRNRVFEARELIDMFTALERQLASAGGDTRTSPPERRVPLRPQPK